MIAVLERAHAAGLKKLRLQLIAAIDRRDHEAAHQFTGRIQGYLMCLRDADQIDKAEMRALETELMTGINFLINAREAAA